MKSGKKVAAKNETKIVPGKKNKTHLTSRGKTMNKSWPRQVLERKKIF